MNALVHLYRENRAAALISAAIIVVRPAAVSKSQREKTVAGLSAGSEAEKSPNLMDRG